MTTCPVESSSKTRILPCSDCFHGDLQFSERHRRFMPRLWSFFRFHPSMIPAMRGPPWFRPLARADLEFWDKDELVSRFSGKLRRRIKLQNVPQSICCCCNCSTRQRSSCSDQAYPPWGEIQSFKGLEQGCADWKGCCDSNTNWIDANKFGEGLRLPHGSVSNIYHMKLGLWNQSNWSGGNAIKRLAHV